MIELLLPRTDAGVFVQVAVVAVVGALAVAATWRNRELRLFAVGCVVLTAGWMALRTVH